MTRNEEEIKRLTDIVYSYLNKDKDKNDFGDKSMSPKIYSTREEASKMKPFSSTSDTSQEKIIEKLMNNESEVIDYLESKIVEKIVEDIGSKVSTVLYGRDTR